ncbi:MAG TPA: DUF5683 domain-containing protein [Chitinophagales bacterium]|nr:DUF5683 domain-containing protein [Chitinophagales bacterium]
MKNFSSAQDSLRAKVDSLPKEKIHSPTFAAVASAIVPGAGQVYNRKYWKVPIVYAGLATAGFFAYFNGNVYYTVRNNLNSRVAGDSTWEPQFLTLNSIVSKTIVNLNAFTYDEMIQLEDDYRKYFTLSIIAGSVVYLLNILDAIVDAHLYQFDVSDNLSLHVQPQIFSSLTGRMAPGFSLSLSIK